MKYEGTLVSLRSREGLALLFALAVVLAIVFLSFRSWRASARHAEQVEVTQRTVSGINALLLALTNAETGQRGFLLTGEDRYLDPYRQARLDIPRLLRSLRTAIGGRPDQIQRIDSLTPVIDEKLAELALTIELRRDTGFDAALAVVRSDRGRVLMRQIRMDCAEILAVTNTRLGEYSKQARSSGDEGALISIFGGACLFFSCWSQISPFKKGSRASRPSSTNCSKASNAWGAWRPKRRRPTALRVLSCPPCPTRSVPR